MKKRMNEKMKKHEITQPEEERPEVWHVGDVKDGPVGFRLKASNLRDNGVLHLQFSCADVEGLHSDIEEILGTPFVAGSGNALRKYGLAFDMSVASGTVDETNLKKLGESIMQNNELCTSLASEDETYAIMEYDGCVEGLNNLGDAVHMMKFRIGNPNNKVLIAFSHVEPSIPSPLGSNYPELKGEWLMAWVASRYMDNTEEE
jgi:hypothetical protein